MAPPIVGVNPTLLSTVPLFNVLNHAQLANLATLMVRKSAGRNKVVLSAGDPTDSLYIILTGRTKVQMADEEGKEVILAVLGPGEYFGEMGLLDDAPRSASVVAIEACEFITMSKEAFIDFLHRHPEVTMVIMRNLVKRLREADRKIESLALLDVYGRVARVLMDAADNEEGTQVVREKLPRQDIAKMIGASREMVSRVMKGLETEGYIDERDDGSILLRERLASVFQR